MSNEIHTPSRRDFLKGVVIGAGGYAFGSTLIQPNEAMAQSIESCLEKVPMEARWNLVSGAYVTWYVTHLKTLYDRGCRENFLEYMKETGRKLGAGYKA
jgi:hypothetical protein